MTRLGLIAAALLMGGAQSAVAATPAVEKLGTFQDWSAYAYSERGAKVCFVQSTPKDSLPKGAKRSAINALVTHRPAERAIDVVSLLMGYPLKPGTEVEVDIDGRDFKLFVDKETAWARDSTTDRALAEAMVKGAKMVVKGVSTRGTKTTDSYSLTGFGAAHAAITKGCDVKR
ncbi:MAG: invasion associated locus B family protein [Alphaproteobacteria bacterium]